MKRLFFATVIALFMFAIGANQVQAQQRVQWKATTEMTSATEGTVVLTGEIEKGWHIYGSSMPEGGPAATQIFFKATGVQFTSNVRVSPAKREFDPMFEIELSYWENKVVFKRKFVVTDPENAEITMSVKYQGCNESTCFPPRKDSFTVKIDK